MVDPQVASLWPTVFSESAASSKKTVSDVGHALRLSHRKITLRGLPKPLLWDNERTGA
jgi:hypothetical protein